MHVINNSCFMERVHLEVWTTKRRENLTLKDEGYLFKVARWASVATESKIGSCKSAGDYSELPWINRHMSISEWEAHCLLLHFSASYVIQIYMLDNCMLVFFVIGVIMKEICAVMTWFMEIVKSLEHLKHLCSCPMDHVFCYILYWVLETISHVSWSLILAKLSCSWLIMTIKAFCQKL